MNPFPFNDEYFDHYSHVHELLPVECMTECACSGENYSACKKWVGLLNFNFSRDHIIPQLQEFGAWDDADLEDMSYLELNVHYLWICAGFES